jgi:hypothetical protein
MQKWATAIKSTGRKHEYRFILLNKKVMEEDNKKA